MGPPGGIIIGYGTACCTTKWLQSPGLIKLKLAQTLWALVVVWVCVHGGRGRWHGRTRTCAIWRRRVRARRRWHVLGRWSEETINDRLIMYDATQNVRGICGIGDPAYIAGRWVGYRSATDRQLLTLCVRRYARGVRHWLHERCRYEGPRRWWCHTRHDVLRPEVGSHNGVEGL